MNNPNILALLAALGFGFMLIPWDKTLRNMGNPQFSVIIGVLFIFVGLAQQFLRGGKTNFSIVPLALAVFAALIYMFALTSFNFAIVSPGAKLGVVAAICATYPMIGMLAAAVFMKQLPTLQQFIFIMVAGVGIVGLSLSGKGH